MCECLLNNACVRLCAAYAREQMSNESMRLMQSMGVVLILWSDLCKWGSHCLLYMLPFT